MPEHIDASIGGMWHADGSVIIYNSENIEERIWFRYENPNAELAGAPPTERVR